MARLGAGRRARRGAGRGERAAPGPRAARRSPAARPGLLFGAIMDFSTWVTLLGRAHARQLPRLQPPTSLPFNLAHAIGNVVFCLAFGPALVRALLRFRARFEVRWEPAVAAAGARGRLALVGWSRRRPRAATPAWTTCAPRRTATAVSARPRGRRPRRSTRRGRRSGCRRPAALARRARRRATSRPARHACRDVGDIERTILGLVARAARRRAGRRPRPACADLRRASAATARGPAWSTARRSAVLALRAAGAPAGAGALCAGAALGRAPADRRRRLQLRAARRRRARSTTPPAPSRRSPPARPRAGSAGGARALRFLVARQNPDGGFPLQPGGASNAQSTAWAVQALVAGGRDPGRVRRGGSRTPLALPAAR